ncbi:MAG: ABC transporter permease [Oscillospiraceae bacterium]|nr:ABC transporter permease [Oscillospiraceae bacterium]
MTGCGALTRRNVKLFFKDKGIFFTALITPVILLVLYATFLGNVYRESFTASLPDFLRLPESLIDGCVGGQLISSILAVSCVTVAFCANMQMVQDKVTGSRHDLTVSPVKPAALSMSYYAATLIATLIVCYVAAGLCLAYVATVGWYLSLGDVLLLLLDIFLLVMFGTALSSVVSFFLSSQGQISAVGTIVSSGYGFICGAYMPISQFSEGLQKVIALLPGTYGTVLLRNHAMRGVFAAMGEQRVPDEAIQALRDAIDCNLYFFGTAVSPALLYLVPVATTLLLIGLYILLNALGQRKAR